VTQRLAERLLFPSVFVMVFAWGHHAAKHGLTTSTALYLVPIVVLWLSGEAVLRIRERR
jgi:hypothetical protein